MHAALAGGFLGIFRIHGGGEHRRSCRSGRRRGFGGLRLGFRGLRRRGRGWCGSRRSGGGRRGGRSAFRFAEIVPLLAVECAGGLGGLIFRTAFLRGQGLCRRCRRKCRKTRRRNGAQQSCLNSHPWSPWGIGYLETTHPSAATARDNGAIDSWVKYSDGENTTRRLHSSAVQP